MIYPFGNKACMFTLTLHDENQQALKDPLHVPVGPITITRAISKKIKEALNGLILTQNIPSLAQKNMNA